MRCWVMIRPSFSGFFIIAWCSRRGSRAPVVCGKMIPAGFHVSFAQPAPVARFGAQKGAPRYGYQGREEPMGARHHGVAPPKEGLPAGRPRGDPPEIGRV